MKQVFVINELVYQRASLHQIALDKMHTCSGTEQEIWSVIAVWTNDLDYFDTYTSGSGGAPKLVRLSKAAMQRSAELSAAFFGLKEDTTAFLCLPPAYIAGKMIIIRALVNGWKLIWKEASLNPFEDFIGYADTASITPMQAARILEKDAHKLEAIPVLLVGGGALPEETEAALRKLQSRIYETYGMTETITHIALREIHSPDKVFTTLPGVRVSVNEDDCLVIHAEHLGSDAIVTSDIVDLIDEHHFTYRGRFDSMINSGGIKLYPEELEKKISRFIHAPFVLKGVKDNFYGEKLILCIEGPDMSDVEKEDLLHQIKTVLGPYEVPREIRTVKHIERTSSGKPVRR